MRGNILGDIRAENDTDMLDRAFYETSDYKALLESNDRCVVVGRRGTGKSALVNKLNEYWGNQNGIFVVNLSPEEDQIIGLRGTFKCFGDNFVHIKAGSKLCWRYSLYMEVVSKLNSHYKLQKLIEKSSLGPLLRSWGKPHQNVASKLRNRLRTVLRDDISAEENIADLSNSLRIDEIEAEIFKLFESSDKEVILLIDRLDEGYTPDGMGVALVDGFVQAVIDQNSKFSKHVRGLVFLRDNMYRSIVINDPDFTRNIEGQVLRLHWNEYGLFNVVCNRLRIAFDTDQENNAKIWNMHSAREVHGREGFRIALRLTLYRPRDILVLLNNAFLNANSQDREQIILEDIDASAKSISVNRLHDLHKEYESIFPALSLFTSAFSSVSSELDILGSKEIIDKVLSKDDLDIIVQRDILIFEGSLEVLQRLYGIGFIGIYDSKAGSYVFCHDGRDPAKEISSESKVLIHPCYWLALNLKENKSEDFHVDEIYDEYDIEVSSISEDDRDARLGQIIEEVKVLKPGREDCHSFEEWCLQAIKLIFAGSLSNIELHPNKNGRQQRDIVATNMSKSPVWTRILQDYKSRQIVFEVKNYTDLSGEEYRQMNTYLCNDHGSLGFIITRANDNNLEKGKELDWAQELYFNHGKKIVIKLSERYLVKHLSKLRKPQKHDAANIELNRLIDTYIRQYLILKTK